MKPAKRELIGCGTALLAFLLALYMLVCTAIKTLEWIT